MEEHRVIERMVGIMRRESAHLREASVVDWLFVDAVVDFFRTYTDRTHHGKEEGILFRDLAGKRLSPEDRAAMDLLIEGHRFARRTVAELDEAGAAYRQGRYTALETILGRINALVQFFPMHIRHEDDSFFPASPAYLAPQEQQAMLAEFWDWDRSMIHEKYRAIVDDLARTLETIPQAPRPR